MRSIVLFSILILLIGCIGNNPDHRKSTSKRNAKSSVVKPVDNNQDAVESLMTDEQLKKADEIINVNTDIADKIDGQKLYKTYCAICHGRKGNLNINQAKDLTKSKINLKNAVAQVYFGRGLMTPFKDILKEEEIVAVSKYVETLRE